MSDANRDRRKRLRVGSGIAALVAVGVAALLLLAPVPSVGHQEGHEDDRDEDDRDDERISAPDFQDQMRKLWEDHATWTRMVIVGIAHDSPNLGVSLARLLANQDDIGDAIKPLYGEKAGDALTALLKDHIVIAGEILTTAKAGGDIDDALGRWHRNGDDIARFLSDANPKHWSFAGMRAMMTEHLDLTLKEAVAELSGDYATSVSAYDEVHEAILHMADMLTVGIVKQFPKKFSGEDLIKD